MQQHYIYCSVVTSNLYKLLVHTISIIISGIFSCDSQQSLEGNDVIDGDGCLSNDQLQLHMPEIYLQSAFDLENFSTLLLPSNENRPLDETALKGIKNTLMESGSRYAIYFSVYGFFIRDHFLGVVISSSSAFIIGC